MNCRDREKDIALLAGGDLSVAEAAELEQHLETCFECAALRASLEESQASLALLGEGAFDTAAVVGWRDALMSRVAHRKRRVFLWAWGLAGAAAAVLAVVFALPGARVPPPPAPVALRMPPPEVAPAATVRRARPHPRRRHVELPTEPLLVKLETQDPQVVIYWIVDGKGD